MGKKETLYKNGVVPTTENIKPRPLTSDELIFAKHEKAIYQPTDDLKKESGVVSSAFGNTNFGESKFDDPNMKSEAILDGQYQDIRGELQSRADKLFNAVPRLLSKVGTEVAKTPGYLYALGEAGLTDKTLAESLDNAWLNGLEHADQAVKDEFAIYKPKSVREGNLWDNVTSTSFWTDEGVDGVGFLLSMMAPGAALKATGIAGKLAKLPMLSKLGAANIELGIATILNTGLEAMAETKGLVDDLDIQFEAKIEKGEINPTTGRTWTKEEAKEAIGKAAVDIFQQNLAILLVPNMIMNKNLLGRFKGSQKVLDEFKDATGRFVTTNPIVKKSLIKEYAKRIGTATVSEGFVEEAGQTTFENYNKKVAFGDETASIASEYVNTLTTTEGQKSILLGAVLGGLGGVVGAKKELKAEDKQRKVLSTLIKDNFQGFSVSMDNLVEKDAEGKIVLDPITNKPKINIDAAKNVIINLAKEQQSSNLMDLAALNNDKDMYDFIFNQQLSRFAIPYLNVEGGDEILNQHIDDLSNRITDNTTNKTDEATFKASVKDHIKDLKKINESLIENVYDLPLEDLSTDTKIVGEFSDILLNTAYQESSKQIFLNKRIEELNRDMTLLHADAANVSQFTIEREKLANRINTLSEALKVSKANYESVFNKEQVKAAFEEFSGSKKEAKEKIVKEESKAAKQNEGKITDTNKPKTKPVENTQEEPYTGPTQDLDSLLGGEPTSTSVEDKITEVETKKADIERRRKLDLFKNTPEQAFSGYANDTKLTSYNEEGAITDRKEGKSLTGNRIQIFKTLIDLLTEAFPEKYQSLKNIFKPNPSGNGYYITINDFTKAINILKKEGINTSKEGLTQLLDLKKQRISEINAKYDAELATLEGVNTELKASTIIIPNENTTVDIVSENLNNNTASNTSGDDQVTQNPSEKQKGFFSDISHGMSTMGNVVMMKLFNNYFENGVFKFERDDNGVPLVNTNSQVDVEELNNVKVGDTVTFELVTLEGKALEDYNKSKEESISHINHHITNMGNMFGYETNDTSYGFDDKHIAIKSNGNIIGYVQQPHAISNNAFDETTGNIDQAYIDARNQIVAQRKVILNLIAQGKADTTIEEKGSGNLYTKLTEDGKVDTVNDLFTEPRSKDLTPNGNLIFVYNDGKGLQLPAMDDSDMESDIKLRLAKLGNWGSTGSVFQLIKDTNDEWYPIPVYSNLIEDHTIKGIINAIKGLSNSSKATDVVNALNPYIYSTFSVDKNAPIKIDDRGETKLTIDGISHTIDNLNKGIGLADFKKSLYKTKRQNINVLNINSSFTQDDIKKRKTLSSNAVTYKGEYLVQPFISYKPMGISPEVKEYKAATKATSEPALNTEVESETPLQKAIRLKREKGEQSDPGFSRSNVEGVSVNINNFKTWLSKNLPGLTLSDVKDLSALKSNINDALGAYRNMVIYLFNGATNKTAYHEAFHGVFRNMLSNEEKFALIEEAITKYKAPTQKDLDFLQKGLKGIYTNEQLTYLYYEEKLADDFAEFVDNKPVDTVWTKIKAFFNKVLSMFDMFTKNKQSKVDTLFNAINTGKFAKTSNVTKKNNIALVNRELNGELFNELAYARNSAFSATVKWDRTKSIGDNFMIKYQALVNQGTKDVKASSLFEEIKKQYLEASENSELLDKMSLTDVENLDKIINNWDFLKSEATKYLENYNIKLTKNDTLDAQEQTVTDEDTTDVEVSTLASQTTKGLGDWVTQAGLKSASVRIKMFVSSIPVVDENNNELKDAYGFPKYHEFNQVYYLLERSLTGLNTFEEMIAEMNKLSDLRPELKTVVDRLTKPSTFTNKEELVKLQNDFKSNFTKQQLNYVLVKFDTDSNSGNVTYKIFDANRQSVTNIIEEEWKNNLTNPNRKTIIDKDGEEVIMHGTAESRRMTEQWSGLVKNILKGNGDYDAINRFLIKLGIEITPDVLQKSISKGNKSELPLNVADILKFYVTENPTEDIQKAYDRATKNLIDLQANSIILSYTQSFNNVENSNIYTIQLPSFASKLMDDLSSRDIRKFKSRLAALEKDPLYKYSNILRDLKEDNDFRTTKFRLNYLDGLKDERGSSDGSKFTNMSPKDYMAMQIALFQNLFASSGGKIAKAKTSKYIYVTPSDKSMAMIYDGKSYNAQLNDQEDIDINTPIVNNFYNVVLQEAARIQQQLQVKAKVLSGELSTKDLLTHYHYAPKSDVKSFDGFAYQIMNFEGLNTKFKDAITEAVSQEGEVQDLLIDLEESLKAELAQILRREFHNTLNEAVDKGIIREVSKGNYENIALDIKGSKSIKQTIADFALNTWLNNIEMSNLLNGDSALYKAKDLQKRTYQSGAMGVNINIQDKPFAKTKVVKDFETKNDMSKYEDLLLEMKVPQDSINDILNKYGYITKSQDSILKDSNTSEKTKKEILDSIGKNNVTDAQVLVSPEFYKAIFVGRGTWTPAMQTAYDIAEGNITNPTPVQLEEARLQLSNIKPFYFGNRFDEKLGIQRFEQVKCAMLPLFKSYVNSNPLLAEKRAEMDNQSLDMIAFESAFKAAIGYRESITSNGGNVLELDMNNFMVQVDNPAHIMDDENDSIRQLKMLILGNIDPSVSYNGKQGSDIIKEIDNIEGVNIEDSLKDLNKMINGKNSEEFKKFLKEMLTKRNATENIMEALNIIDGEFEYALDGGPTSVQMQNLISSLFTNKVIKQSFAGGSGVQASAIGMRYKGGNPTLDKMQSDLQFVKNENGSYWSEAMMPAWTSEFFNADGTHKDNIPDSLKELLFYRIPTEGFHSMMAIKVKGFLPVEYGNTILMPYEVTTQFGADFDFDKVYFLSPEFTKNDKGELVKVEYDDTKTVRENSRAARNNKILDNYLKVLSSKEILPLALNPSGFEYLAKIKADIDRMDNIQSTQTSFFSSATQRDYKTRNHVGMGLKGQLALHVTGHSYATLLDLKMKVTQYFGGITFNNITATDLSRLYSLDGSKLISKEVSSMMAAILDDIKNPIIQALGINEFTADTWATIVRAGFDAKTAVNFITQPVIVELSSKLAENNYKIKAKDAKRNSGDTLLEDYKQRLKLIYDGLTEDEKKSIDTLPTYEQVNGLNDTNLVDSRHFKSEFPKLYKDAYSRNPEWSNVKLAIYYSYQIDVLHFYNQYDKIAKDLVKINRFFGVNKQVGPTFEDIVNKKYLLNEIEEKGFSIEGLNSSTLDKVKSLKASYDTHLSTLDFLAKYFPYDSDVYNTVKLSYLNSNIKFMASFESISKLPVEKRMLINNFIRNYIDYNSDNFIGLNSSSAKEAIYKKIPLLIDMIKNTSNDEMFFNGALRKTPFIEALQVKFDDKAKGIGYITIKANRLDTQHKNNIAESIYSLYNSPKTKSIIEDLVKYSFIATGFHRGLKSFHDLIPPTLLKEMGYTDFRKSVTKGFKENRAEFDSKDVNRLLDQLIRNFPSEFTKTFDASTFKKSGKNLVTDINLATASGRLKELVTNVDDLAQGALPIYTKYLRVYDNAAKKSVLYIHTGNGVFKPISKLGKAGNMIEIDVTSDIENSLIPENNLDNKSILTTFADETSTDEEIERPVYDSDEFIGTPPQDLEDLISKSEPKPKSENTEEDWNNETNDCGI